MKVKITVASSSSLHTQTLVRDLISQCEVLQFHRKPSGASWWISKHCPLRFFAQPDISPSLPWWPDTLFSDVHQDPWLVSWPRLILCAGSCCLSVEPLIFDILCQRCCNRLTCHALYQNGEVLSSFSKTSWNSLTWPEESCLGLSRNDLVNSMSAWNSVAGSAKWLHCAQHLLPLLLSNCVWGLDFEPSLCIGIFSLGPMHTRTSGVPPPGPSRYDQKVWILGWLQFRFKLEPLLLI